MTMKNSSKYTPSAVLSRLFYRLGYHIAHFPKLYIIGPIILAATLSTGVLNLVHIKDPEFLYAPTTGEFKYERAVMQTYFPDNLTEKFDASRVLRIKRFARLLIKSTREDMNLINPEAWQEMQLLDSLVHNVTIEWKGKELSYNDMCGRWNGVCYENTFLEMANLVGNISKGILRLSYPIMFNAETLNVYPLPQYFGGVTLKNDSHSVASVEAITFHYFIGVGNDEQDLMGQKWESSLLSQLENFQPNLKEIKVYKFTFETVQEEVETNLFSVVPTALITIVFMIAFTVWSSVQGDAVRSKPWLGLIGVVSALLGAIASFGILFYAGVPFITLNVAVPFIMLGIGVDDTFVMLSAWRCTDPSDPVPKRLAEAYSEAAVSVTITSLTDMLSFFVGILTPIPSISIFSVYAGTGVLCIYLWHLCFFGAAMAISGYHEAENRHGLLWWIKATPKSQAGDKSTFHKLFFTGGVCEDDPKNPVDKAGSENMTMAFFRDKFSPMLLKTSTQTLVILSFIAYLAISFYGVTQIKEGIKREKLVRDDSYMTDFFLQNDKYFNDYPYRLQLVITNPLDYSDITTQNKIKSMMDEFFELDFLTREYTENWLQSYTRHLELYKDFFDLNITTEQDFNSYLANEYLPNQPLMSEDVVFNENKTKIIATRYILQSVNIRGSDQEKNAVISCRSLAKRMFSEHGLNVTMYHPAFHFIDQFVMIGGLTLRLVAMAAVLCLGIAVILIPSFISSFCVFFSICSIEFGVLGFMSIPFPIFNPDPVHLDLISIVCLIMSIGFSVDFSAHISYAYVSRKDGSSPLERLQYTMHSLGYPILQGGISSIIGVIAMIVVPSYVFHVFFKIMVLIIVFAIYHALFILPVLLTILHSYSCPSFKLRSFSRAKGFTLNHDTSKSNDVENLKSTFVKTIPS